jgi:hypothetical protein
MKKSKTPYIVIAIVFIIYNLLAFVIPSEKTATFWIAYAFGIVSFAVAAFTWKRTIDNGKDLMSKYYKIPVVQLGMVYVIVSSVLMLLFKFATFVPTWAVFLICALLLCVVCIGLITVDSAVDVGTKEIERIEQNISTKRAFIKDLQIEVEMLAETESDSEIKERLTALAKKIRLSDPMSDDSVSDIENEIITCVKDFGKSDKLSEIDEIEMLLLKRNKKVKAMKG